VSIKKKTGLGKGMGSLIDGYSLDFLLGENEEEGKSGTIATNSGAVVHEIEIEKIRSNPHQPRKNFDEKTLLELADSIKDQGILQPIIVEELTPQEYTIIAGERRYRAAKLAGLKKIPVLIRSFSDMQRLEVALIENIQRENLNAIEEAHAYAYLLQETSLTHDELSKKLGKSRSTITNSLRLLQLPEEVQQGIIEGTYSAGHARAFLSLVNPADRILMLKNLREKHLSVREAEKLAADLNQGKKGKNTKKDDKEKGGQVGLDPDLHDIQEKYIQALGCKVEIKGSLDKGKITIAYKSSEELERIYQILSPGSDLFEV
jgi:ParB family chromosome partitioning protein